ncbi:MAG: ribosome biogenesis GTP-binding protein YihA/YsxC [Pseudomonadota bacterium]
MILREASFITTAVDRKGYPPPGPPEVAFAGRSNVGKSSLINALTGRRKLVRVSSRPGCTQQINFFSINNEEMRLVDLPGYGFAKVPLAVKAQWQAMIEGYLTKRPTLRGVVVILDVRREVAGEDALLLEWLRAYGIPILVAVTKVDKLSKNQAASRLATLKRVLKDYDPTPTAFSALTGQGRDELWARIAAQAAAGAPAPEPGPDPADQADPQPA